MARGFTVEQLEARRAREAKRAAEAQVRAMKGYYKDIRDQAALLARIAGYNNASDAELRRHLKQITGAVDRLERYGRNTSR
jgi:hypothetical protein